MIRGHKSSDTQDGAAVFRDGSVIIARWAAIGRQNRRACGRGKGNAAAILGDRHSPEGGRFAAHPQEQLYLFKESLSFAIYKQEGD